MDIPQDKTVQENTRVAEGKGWWISSLIEQESRVVEGMKNDNVSMRNHHPENVRESTRIAEGWWWLKGLNVMHNVKQ